MHVRATKQFNYGLLLATPKEKKRKEKNYLHGKAPNKQKKNGKSFWVFLFNYYYYIMKSKLTKSYYYFFCFS